MAFAQTSRTVLTGSDGNVAFAALGAGQKPQGRFSSFNLNLNQVINNVSKFSTTGDVWQEFVGGAKSATWGTTSSMSFGAATVNPFGGAVTAGAGSLDILPQGGCTATFTFITDGLITNQTACNVVWTVIVQGIGTGVDATGGSYATYGGVCTGAPTTIAWDEA
jgi:hypothetical protein